MTDETVSPSQSWVEESDSWADSIGETPDAHAPASPSWRGPEAPQDGTDSTQDYSLSLPQGVEADSELLAEFSTLAREAGLSPATARKILDLEVKNAQRQIEAFTRQQQAWREAITNDPHFGGSRLSATVRQARKALETFDPEGTLLPELNRTGYGNHPGIIRFLARVGRTLQEDTVFHTRGHTTTDKRPLRDRLWPD